MNIPIKEGQYFLIHRSDIEEYFIQKYNLETFSLVDPSDEYLESGDIEWIGLVDGCTSDEVYNNLCNLIKFEELYDITSAISILVHDGKLPVGEYLIHL